MPSQRDYDLKWANHNRDHRRYLSRRSSARTFIRRYASLLDLKELQQMSKERKYELLHPITLSLGSNPIVETQIQSALEHPTVPFKINGTGLINLKTFYDFLTTHLKQDDDFTTYIHDFVERATQNVLDNTGLYQLAPFRTRSGKIETIHYSYDMAYNQITKKSTRHYIFKEDWDNGNDR